MQQDTSLMSDQIDLSTLSVVLTQYDKLTEKPVRRLTKLTVYLTDGRRFSREDGHEVGVDDPYSHPFLTPATLLTLFAWPEEWTRPKDAKKKLPHLLPVVRNEFRLRGQDGILTQDEICGMGYSQEEVARMFQTMMKAGEMVRHPDGTYRAATTYHPDLTNQPVDPPKQPPLIPVQVVPTTVNARTTPRVGFVVRGNSDTAGTEAYADPSTAHVRQYCRCGCETPTKSRFAPGHDARFFGRANRIQQGKPKPQDTAGVPEEVIRDMETVEIPHHYAKPVK